MKTLKLGLIFAAVVAVVIVVMNISGEDTVKHDKEYYIRLQEYIDRVKKRLANIDGYDETVYQNTLKDIDSWQKMNAKTVDAEGRATLRLTLFENMLKKICTAYDTALANYNSNSYKILTTNNKGLLQVEKDMQKPLDDDATRVKNTHKLFTSISAFVKSGHPMKAEFDGASWTSFESKKSNIIATAKSYRNNPLYQSMKHVPGFANGLNIDKLTNELDGKKTAFYNDLSTQIMEYFDYSDNRFDDYNRVVERFGGEAGEYSSSFRNLASALQRYYEKTQNQQTDGN